MTVRETYEPSVRGWSVKVENNYSYMMMDLIWASLFIGAQVITLKNVIGLVNFKISKISKEVAYISECYAISY